MRPLIRLALLTAPAHALPSPQTAPQTCAQLVRAANAHARQVVPDWPGGMDWPSDEQADAMFAADGAGDVDAVRAMDLFAEAEDRGCW